jgi:hypothetical protein
MLGVSYKNRRSIRARGVRRVMLLVGLATTLAGCAHPGLIPALDREKTEPLPDHELGRIGHEVAAERKNPS